MVDRHVHQQRLLFQVVAAAAVGANRRVAPEVDRDLVQPSQRLLSYERRDRARGWEIAVVLADHQHQAGAGGHVHELLGGADAGRERLLDQDVQPRLERGPRHGHVARQRRGIEDRLRFRRGDRLPQRLEDHARPGIELLAQEVERVGVGVDVGDELDLAYVWDHPPGPTAAVRAQADLRDSQRIHGRNDA